MLRATLTLTTAFFGLKQAPVEQAFDALLSAIGANADPAAEKLGEALGEIEKMLTALDAELVRFLVLDLSSADVARADMQTLVELSAGQAEVNIETARGHCSRIKLIYQKHLEGWLSGRLQSGQKADIARIFQDLDTADSDIIEAAFQINAFLSENAEAVLEHLANHTPNLANDLIAEARRHTLPIRRQLFANMAVLRRYEAAFQRAARLL